MSVNKEREVRLMDMEQRKGSKKSFKRQSTLMKGVPVVGPIRKTLDKQS